MIPKGFFAICALLRRREGLRGWLLQSRPKSVVRSVRHREGVWSLTVTRNWRITLRIDTEEAQIVDLNYEH